MLYLTIAWGIWIAWNSKLFKDRIPYLSRVNSRTLASGTPIRHAGLGLTLPGSVPLTSRGRKSYLSKAIKRVGAEVASGRQSTLDGVLRALNTPNGVPP